MRREPQPAKFALISGPQGFDRGGNRMISGSLWLGIDRKRGNCMREPYEQLKAMKPKQEVTLCRMASSSDHRGVRLA